MVRTQASLEHQKIDDIEKGATDTFLPAKKYKKCFPKNSRHPRQQKQFACVNPSIKQQFIICFRL
jgi:hypothetical protein